MRHYRRHKNTLPKFLLIACILATTVVVSACGENWVVRVNGKIIDEETFKKRLTEVSARYPGQVPTEKDGKRFDAFRGTVAEDMATRILLKEEAEKRGVKVTEAQVEEGIKEVINGRFYGNKKTFEKAIESEGISLERAREQLAEGMLIASLKQEIDSEVPEPTDQEAKIAYERNPKKYELASAVKARHILLETEDEANKILAKLNSGEDMAKLASSMSKDTASKSKGGDIGWLQRGSSEPGFEAVAFSLAIGEYSKPIKTRFGWHILTVEEKKDAYQRTFEQAKPTIKKEMLEQAREKYWSAWLEKVRKEAKIEYRDGYEPPEDEQDEK